MSEKRKIKEIDPKFLEDARKRALESNPLTDKQRAEIALLWSRQDSLPKKLRDLVVASNMSSGWVLNHLFPRFAIFTASKASQFNNFQISDYFNSITSDYPSGLERSILLLTNLDTQIFEDEEVDFLRKELLKVLDFGLLGMPIFASIVAQSNGLIDTSTVLMADGNLTLLECIKASENLGDQVSDVISSTDIKDNEVIFFPPELIPPNNFNS